MFRLRQPAPRDEAVQNCPVWSERMPNEARFRNDNTIREGCYDQEWKSLSRGCTVSKSEYRRSAITEIEKMQGCAYLRL